MRRPVRLLKWLAVALAAGLALALVAALVVRTWVVPAVLTAQIAARTGGRVEIGRWYLNNRGAGVVGLRLYDGAGAGAPAWASVGRVATDLTIPGLLRGRYMPGRVKLEGGEVALRFDAKGNLLTKLGTGQTAPASPGPAPALPTVIAEGARLKISQEGRPDFELKNLTARLGEAGGRVVVAGRANDPAWGRFEATGDFAPDFRAGKLVLKSVGGLDVTPAKAAALPFVPPEVWANVTPEGEVDARLTLDLDAAATPPLKVGVEVLLRGASVTSKLLQITAEGATGRVVVDGPVVRLEGVAGRAVGGTVRADGALNFAGAVPKLDVQLGLEGVDVTKAPKAWQLDEAGATGRLSGRVHLVAQLKPEGPDLTGTTGEAVVRNGTFRGLPVEALRLTMDASGGDLRYGSQAATAGAALPPPETPPAGGSAAHPGFRLPQTLSTTIDLADVELTDLLARAQLMLGMPLPLPVSGLLSMQARATIPLGEVRDFKRYAFHGDLTLKRASLYGVDLGLVAAHVDLEDGVIDLRDFRGRLVDRPDGGIDNLSAGVADAVDVPKAGPLPVGGFRGGLHAAFAPPGKLTASFEGREMPLGELAAPVLPRPTPLSGLTSVNFRGAVDLGSAGDPKAWDVAGHADSRRLRYHKGGRAANLDGLASRFTVSGGVLKVQELSARLRGQPLLASGEVDLQAPLAFRGEAAVTAWDIADLAAWVPGVPNPPPATGTVTIRADASGTAAPFTITTRGRGRFDALRAFHAPVGTVPFGWDTAGDLIELNVTDARPFGGRVDARAAVPLTAGKPLSGKVTVAGLDAARLASAFPKLDLRMTGRVDGGLDLAAPADLAALDLTARLTAPGLTVRGVPVDKLRAAARARDRSLAYDLEAEGLGGTFQFKGEFPLEPTPLKSQPGGEARAVGFALDQLWRALGMSGSLSAIGGRGAVDANVRLIPEGPRAGLYAHGQAEVRDLRYRAAEPFGRVRGVVAVTPGRWRVDDVGGDLLGGPLHGSIWGVLPSAAGTTGGGGGPLRGVDLRLDGASLKTVAVTLGYPAHLVEGFGNVRVAGDGARLTADLRVARAKVAGLPVSDVRLPVDLTTFGGSLGTGIAHVRHWSGRVAGGRARGDGLFRLGADRSFQTTTVFDGMDIETVTRLTSDSPQTNSGRISGRLTLQGHDPTKPHGYRGRIVADLDDASLVNLAVVREVDKFLGGAGGGLIEDGDLVGTVANGQLIIESMTLEGRLAQVHVTGNVGFNGALNLEALVGTSQALSSAGAALGVGLPALGRDRQGIGQASNFLSGKLIKLRIGGDMRNPVVQLDPSIGVGETAVSFFTGVMKLPLGLVR